ncbi:MAG: 2-oxoacid:acceptor oxidoreductase subunit alpha [Candidatus Thorarchaeota archaeon]
MDFTFNIGGAAGQGIDTIGDLLTRVFVKAGYYTFTIKDFESRIRGGYNFSQVRVSDRPVYAARSSIDVIIALTEEAITRQVDSLADGGVVIYDDAIPTKEKNECYLRLPLQRVAKEVGGSERMTNAAALGALTAILRFPFEFVSKTLESMFKSKGEKVVNSNIAVARALYEMTAQGFTGKCRVDLSSLGWGPSRDTLVLTGNTALALGAMAANVKWASAYPMSPSTSLFQEIVASAHRLRIGALQPEDEIAALCMALGASFAGARSIVSTSGGGFSLMVEALGLAAMTETPVVIYNAQRPGPSTGLATRTEQGDLLFVTFAGQGDFPRIVLAPRDPVEAFETAVRAFNLSDRYQVPVIILGDQYFADSSMNVARIDVSRVTIDRGKLEPTDKPGPYKRYLLTEDGVSPRAFPGDPGKIVVANGNTHLENGHITEDAAVRNAMVEKFLRKVPRIRSEMRPPALYGEEDADTTLLTWGSSWGPVYEAMNILSSDGVSVNQLHYCDVFPPRTEILRDLVKRNTRIISIEGNPSSQFAKLLQMESGVMIREHINKYDGRPMTTDWVLAQLREVGVR